MKGITPVIAIILLLLITISMVGFAFVWFSRVTQSATTSGTAQINTITGNSQKRLTFESYVQGGANAGKLYIRNSGTAQTLPAEISVYVGNTLDAGAWFKSDCVTALAATDLAISGLYCFKPASAINCPFTAKIQAPGGLDQISC